MSGPDYIEGDVAHALLSASDSRRWVFCHGALFATADKENESSEYAKEGTAAHTLAAWCQNDQRDADAYLGRIIEVEGDDFEVTQEMADNVQAYLDRLVEYRTRMSSETLLDAMVEVPVNYAEYLGVDRTLAWGTSDNIVLDYERQEIQVHDLKYGKGERVDAEGNTQLILYGLGALAEVELLGDWKTVLLVIHQPRLNHLSEFRYTITELRNWGVRLSYDAKQSLAMYEGRIAPVYTAGRKQCRWCAFEPECPEAANLVMQTALAGFDDVGIPNVRPAPEAADALARAGSMLPFIQEWCKNVAGALDTAMLHKGIKVPGFKIVRGKAGHRKWTDAAEVAGELSAAGVPDEVMYKPRELRTPADLEKEPTLREKQGRKVVLHGALKAALEAHVHQPKGALTVVPMGDPRPEEHVDPSAGFENVDEEEV